MKLTQNTILITGGTSGIGYEFASRLIDLGNTVIITGRDPNKLAETAQKLKKVHTFQSDVSDPEAIIRLYENVTRKFPDINVLINNAGIMRNLNLHDPAIDLQDVTREIETNLSGTVRMVQQFLPHLKSKGSPAIINISSGLAFVPLAISPIYSATKAGIHSYTQALRVQLKNTKIKVFEVAPPGTDTPLQNEFDGYVDLRQMMRVDKMVSISIKGLKADKLEIRPGLSNVLKLISRIAPGFGVRMLGKPVDKMLQM